ncbi:hypothetical protein IWQ62_000947 [Dispira parvispora]|uniref:Kinesin motor domain-containing protein n=1 Tax=Dispira parvispora TaxID=1520584 RepID=A0A9W8E9M0_9FUNG|nr:hypothetical protein IWQ62_000947 [Dispira parvispora]
MTHRDSLSKADPGQSKDADHINVNIRIRPLNSREQRQGAPNTPWLVQNDTITQLHYHAQGRPSLGNSYTFDSIFEPQHSTGQVFEKVADDIINSLMAGFNGTIFAYGQTSSGKTHTMYGTLEEPGVIDLSIRRIFHMIEQTPEREYLLRVSFLEIYNEVIKDLLNPENHHLKIHEHAKRGIFVGNLTENIVMSIQDVRQLLEQGDKNRHVGETNMNDHSSRSHTIFRMVIESRERSVEDAKSPSDSGYSGAVKVSCLNLVDLAGSERVSQTGAEGARLREGAHINKSLLALGTVIAKLSESGNDAPNVHIPYRDSKLTRILEPSLGGNAKTAIICTITPAGSHVEETLSTLKFANRAKNVCNKPQINEELSGEALLRVYNEEISMLKKKLDEYRTMDGSREIEKLTHQKMKIEEYNEEIRRQLREKESEENRLRKHYDELKMMILDSSRVRSSTSFQNRAVRRQTWFPGTRGNLVAQQPTPAMAVSGPTNPVPTQSTPPQSAERGMTNDIGVRPGKRRASDMERDSNHIIKPTGKYVDDAHLDAHRDTDSLPISQHPNTFRTIAVQNKTITQLQETVRQLTENSQSQLNATEALAKEKERILQTLQWLLTDAEETTDTAALDKLPSEIRELYQYLRNYRQALSFTKETHKRSSKRRKQEEEFLKLELEATQLSYTDLSERYERETAKLLGQVDDLSQKYSALEDRGRMEVDLLGQQLTEYKAKLKTKSELDAELTQVREALAQSEEQVKALTEAQDGLAEQATADQELAQQQAKQLAEWETTVLELRNRLAQLERDNQTLTTVLEGYRAELPALRSSLQDAVQRQATHREFMAGILRGIQSYVGQLRKEMEDGQQRVSEAAAARCQLETELAASQGRITDLEAQLRLHQSQHSAQVECSSSRISQLESEFTAAQGALSTLREEHAAQLDAIQSRISMSCDASTEQLEILQRETQEMTQKHEHELHAIQQQVQEREQMLQAAREELQQAQELLTTTQEQLAQVMADKEEISAQFNTFRTETKAELQARDVTIDELRTSLASDRQAAHQSNHMASELEQRVKCSEAALAQCSEELTVRLEAMLEESERLESELGELRDSYEELVESHCELRASEEEARASLAYFEQETQELTKERDQLQTQLTNLSQSVTEHQQRLEELTTTNSALTEEMETLRTSYASQLEVCAEHQQATELLQRDFESERAAAQAQVEKLEAALQDTQLTLGDRDELQQSLLDTRAELSKRNDELDQVKAFLDQVSQVKADVEARLATSEATHNELATTSAAQVSGLEGEIDHLREALTVSQGALHAVEAKATTLQSQHVMYSSTYQQLINNAHQLRSRHDASVQELQRSHAQFTSALAQLRTVVSQEEHRYTELTRKYQNLQEDRRVKEATIEQLTSALNSRQTQHYEYRAVWADMAMDIDKVREDVGEARGRAQTNVQDLQQWTKQARTMLCTLREETTATRLRLQALAQEHADLQTELQTTSLARDKLSSELEHLCTSHQEIVMTKDARLESLLQELDTAKSDAVRQQAVHDELTKQVAHLEATLTQAEAQREEVMALAVREVTEARDEWDQQSAAQTAELEQLRRLQATRLPELENQLSTLQATLADQEAAMKSLRASKVDAQSQLFELKEKVTGLKAERKELLTQVDQFRSEEVIRKKQIDFQKSELEKWKLAYKHEQKKTRKLATAYESRLKELQQSVTSKQQQITELQQLVHERESEVQQSNRKLAQAENDRAAGARSQQFSAAVEDTTLDQQSLAQTFKREIETLERENHRLQQECRTAMMAKNNEITKSRQLTASVNHLQAELDKCKREIERLTSQSHNTSARTNNGGATKTPIKTASGHVTNPLGTTKRVTRSMVAGQQVLRENNVMPSVQADENGITKAPIVGRATRQTHRPRRTAAVNASRGADNQDDCNVQ